MMLLRCLPPFSARCLARVGRAVGVLATVAAVAGCGSFDKGKLYAPQEKFSSGETYSRLYDAPPAAVCKSARLALLSQGYLVTATDQGAGQVEGRKNFQPEAGAHVEMVIRVVCVPDASANTISMAFASAVQDTYTVRRVSNSASVGVGALGSLSVPFGESSEGLTKVGSQTIQSSDFYDKLFALIRQYIVTDDPLADADADDDTPTPKPAPAPSASSAQAANKGR